MVGLRQRNEIRPVALFSDGWCRPSVELGERAVLNRLEDDSLGDVMARLIQHFIDTYVQNPHYRPGDGEFSGQV